MLTLKALLAWLVILVLAIANGALREAVLIPSLGRPAGLILSGVLLCLLVALVAHGLVRSRGSFTASQGLYIGTLWLGLTLVFEFTFGRFVQHKSWNELLEAYAFKEGNLWPLVLVVVLLAPLAAALWQAKSARATLAALAVLVLAAWTPEAAALDRAGAIEAAKRQMGSRCNAATPCGFEAKAQGDRWHVRVEFLKDDTAPGKPAGGARTHAIYIFNQSGRVVGTIKGK
jgi:hypothetical protein